MEQQKCKKLQDGGKKGPSPTPVHRLHFLHWVMPPGLCRDERWASDVVKLMKSGVASQSKTLCKTLPVWEPGELTGPGLTPEEDPALPVGSPYKSCGLIEKAVGQQLVFH